MINLVIGVVIAVLVWVYIWLKRSQHSEANLPAMSEPKLPAVSEDVNLPAIPEENPKS